MLPIRLSLRMMVAAVVVAKAATRSCPDACIQVYEPVCGSDGKTYGNSCMLGIASCNDPSITLKHDGECSARTARDVCPNICPAIYQPQCGSDGMTYGNECTLRIAICKNRNLFLKHPGECRATSRPCPDACPFNYDPVCGSDGKTYGNDCQLGVASCNDPSITLKHRGECQAPPRQCPEVCPLNFDPVCGSDGKTYGNDCQLGVASCNDPSITLKHRGQCQDPVDECEARQCSDPSYQPVCGSDGKTYRNNCAWANAACRDRTLTIKHTGACQSYIPPPNNCGPGICPAVYQPVCGSDGKIYSNSCFFNFAKCKNPKLEQGSRCYNA